MDDSARHPARLGRARPAGRFRRAGAGHSSAIGLVLYFICAVSAHARVRDPHVARAVTFLALAMAALAALAFFAHQLLGLRPGLGSPVRPRRPLSIHDRVLALSDVPSPQIRAANALNSTAQQLFTGLAVALATVAMRVGHLLGHANVARAQYTVAFLAVRGAIINGCGRRGLSRASPPPWSSACIPPPARS